MRGKWFSEEDCDFVVDALGLEEIADFLAVVAFEEEFEFACFVVHGGVSACLEAFFPINNHPIKIYRLSKPLNPSKAIIRVHINLIFNLLLSNFSHLSQPFFGSFLLH